MINKKRGQSLVELTLILPIFLIIIFGIFDIGRAIFYLSGIHNAAREGARYGAVNPCDSDDIVQRARDYSFGIGDAANVTTSIQNTAEGFMDRMIVTVTYQFTTITPLVGSIIGDIPLTSESRHFIEVKTVCP